MEGDSRRYDEYGVPSFRDSSHPSLPLVRIFTKDSPSLSSQSFESFSMSSLPVAFLLFAISLSVTVYLLSIICITTALSPSIFVPSKRGRKVSSIAFCALQPSAMRRAAIRVSLVDSELESSVALYLLLTVDATATMLSASVSLIPYRFTRTFFSSSFSTYPSSRGKNRPTRALSIEIVPVYSLPTLAVATKTHLGWRWMILRSSPPAMSTGSVLLESRHGKRTLLVVTGALESSSRRITPGFCTSRANLA